MAAPPDTLASSRLARLAQRSAAPAPGAPVAPGAARGRAGAGRGGALRAVRRADRARPPALDGPEQPRALVRVPGVRGPLRPARRRAWPLPAPAPPPRA